MEINWFTFFAQVINFVILVAILKRLLYRRVLQAIDKREQEYTTLKDTAELAQKQAQEAVDCVHKEKDELARKTEGILAQAKKEAAVEKSNLLEKARGEVAARREKWIVGLEREEEAFFHALRHQLTDNIEEISRKVLHDLAGADLEGKVIDVFLGRLENRKDEVAMLADTASASNAVVQTSFSLNGPQKERLQQALKDRFPRFDTIEFEHNTDFSCGIELLADGHSLGWHIDDYLTRLFASTRLFLEQEIDVAAHKAGMATENQGER
jgi:F-type H+-transporting ATPase subunit b